MAAAQPQLLPNGFVDEFDNPQRVMCRYYIMGTCRYGNKCRFSHDTETANQSICNFYKMGKCKNGSSCRFLHTTEEELKEKARNSNKDATASAEGACAEVAVPEATSWVHAAEFIPGKKYTPRFADESYSSALKTGLPPPEQPPKEDKFCSHHVEGQCLNGDNCPYIHGTPCDICNLNVLHPTDVSQQEKHKEACLKDMEEDMRDSFQIAKTNTLCCGICMEKVSEKSSPADRRFGILENCMHVFCLDCIRKWRSADNFQKKVVKACPECRVASAFVTPSSLWIEDPEEKAKMITEYKESLSRKPCKYFDKGNGKCPFGRFCFYLHAYPDGTKQDKSKLSCKRAFNKHGEVQDLSIHFSEFLDSDMFTHYVLHDLLLGDDDDEDFLDFLHGYDSSLDDSDFDWELHSSIDSFDELV